MAKFFSTDSKLYQFMSRLTDVFKLNILWLLCCLPIVTIGASTIAAFSVTLRMVEDKEGYVSKDFFKAFKANIKQGIPMTFILLLCIWVIYLDFQIYKVSEENSWIFLVIGIITAYIMTFSMLYVFPLLARYENTIFKSLKNSFSIGMKYFFRSIFLLIIVAIEVIIIMWNGTTLFVGVLIGPACIILTISGPAMHIFRLIDKANAAGDELEEED